MKTLEELDCIIPEGWERVTTGLLQHGDAMWSVDRSMFISEAYVEKRPSYGSVDNYYLVIRKKK